MLVQGTNAVIYQTVKNTEGLVFELTGATVIMMLTRPDSDTTVTIPGAVTKPIEGKVQVLLTPEHLSEGGTYRYQMTVTFADATVSKSAVGAFYVADSLPEA